MSAKVRQVKRSINKNLSNLKSVRREVGRGNRSASRKLDQVEKNLSDQQLKLDLVLDRLAFHKGQNKELKKKIKTLRARRG